MSNLATAVLTAYFGTLLVLAVYGCHRYHLLRLYYRHRRAAMRPPDTGEPLPRVTVQLPIYNEMYVVARLIDAACALDYPADRLEIQVLDDSDDETAALAAALVAARRRSGHDIVHLRRRDRAGFKAGALANGLRLARGELIAVFDADFVPGPDFLRGLIPYFRHPRVGMVQARWEHLNREYSLLTRLQAILLDGHFAIEHAARDRSGCFFNFNGTAGIWRRACIESAGGWRSDTLTEDLDLSYRAQLAGWRFVFVPDVSAPAELPPDIESFKTQQHRWTRGSIETGLRVLPVLLRARLPAAVKAEATFHLTNNCAYLLMVLLAILIVPAMVIRHGVGLDVLLLVDLPLFVLSTISVSAFYLCAQREVRRDWRRAIVSLPLLMSLGIGLSLNNARGVLEALTRRRGHFVRTPKFDLCGRRGTWRARRYRSVRRRTLVLLESLFALYFTVACAQAAATGMYASLPFLLLFQSGFTSIAVLSLRGWLLDRRPAAGAAVRKTLTRPPQHRT